MIGARKPDQIKDNLDCLTFEIPAEMLNELNEISAIKLGFPYEFLNSNSVRKIIFGDFVNEVNYF